MMICVEMCDALYKARQLLAVAHHALLYGIVLCLS